MVNTNTHSQIHGTWAHTTHCEDLCLVKLLLDSQDTAGHCGVTVAVMLIDTSI